MLLLTDEAARAQVALDVTDALANALFRAAEVNRGKDPVDVSFSSLFIGLAASEDPVGEWIREKLQPSGLEALLRRRGVTSWHALRSVTANAGEPAKPLRDSLSARAALTEAQRLAKGLGGPTDTRHVMAAYVSLPEYHEDDFRSLTIDRRVWARDLAARMAHEYRQEAEFWRTFGARVFPAADEPGTLDLSPAYLEPHVEEALREAAALADGGAVAAHHVIRAVVALAPEAKSAAFTQLAEIVGDVGQRAEPGQSRRIVFPLALEPALHRQMAWAQRAIPGETGAHVIWGRDLISAALLTNDREVTLLLDKAGHPLNRVRDLWYRFVTSSAQGRPAESWRAWWRAAGVPTPEALRAGYSTESQEGEDCLGIAAEARAFARLILDRDVKAPLSIGLLGDWGSGKSFFLEQVKQQMRALDGRRELFDRVVEVEFNAWHASDANLWASLVTCIFDRIWEEVGKDDDDHESVAAKRAHLVRRIEEARGAVHEADAELEEARVALAKAQKDLGDKRKRLALNRYLQRVGVQKLSELAEKAGWHRPLETINDVDDAARSLAGSGRRLQLALASLAEAPLAYIALPTMIIGLAVVGVWFVAQDPDQAHPAIAQALAWVASVFGGVGVIVAPLKVAGARVSALADQLSKARTEYDAELENAAKKQPDAIALVAERRELASTEASIEAAQKRLTDLLNQHAALDPRRRLGEFLQDRVQSTLYRTQQGMISLVHKDFRALSEYMKELRGESPSVGKLHGAPPPAGKTVRPFDRIVIYVDDLDRCRPEQVVHMLEAVHLLLSLDLFVVVVAVDSRWLMRALEVHHRELLGGTGSDGIRAATPQTYLEKIFQITYALAPMRPEWFAHYVRSLAGAAADETPEIRAKVSPLPPSGPVPGVPGVAPSAAPKRNGGGTPAARSPEVEKATPAAALPPLEAVRIDDGEQALICRLVPLLPTPRIAKRLVNVYRLIKAGKSAGELAAFESGERSKSSLLMLAILFGRPAIASELLRDIYEGRQPFDAPEQPFVQALRRRRGNEAWGRLAKTLEEIGIEVTVRDCAREPIEVARYSLVSGTEWHTWVREERDAPGGADERVGSS